MPEQDVMELDVMELSEGEWIDVAERGGIGGSAVGSILGLNPWEDRGQVFDRIVRRQVDEWGSVDIRRGVTMEPVVRQIYTETTGRVVEYVEGEEGAARSESMFIRDPERPFLLGHTDGWLPPVSAADDPMLGMGEGVLEVKVPRSRNYDRVVLRGIHPTYYAQLQHYIGIRGTQWGAFAVFDADGWRLHHFDVPRDDVMIEVIRERCTDFWNQYVIPRRRPQGAETRIAPPVCPQPGGVAVVRNDGEWADACARLLAAQAEMGLAEHRLKMAKEAVQALMGNADTVVGGGLKVYWRAQVSNRFDEKRFFEENPELAEMRAGYLRQVESRPFKYFPDDNR